jgi:hypothetical protein
MARRLSWIAGAAAVAVALAAIWGAVTLRQADHIQLLALSRSTIQPMAWIYEQGLYRLHPTAEEIRDLNSRAGAATLLTEASEPEARRLLAHYLAAGLDINSINQWSPSGSSTLHYAVISGIPMETRLLLEFGARTDIRDSQGLTPLDLARLRQQKVPDRVELAKIVQLLEGAGRSQGRGASGIPGAEKTASQ